MKVIALLAEDLSAASAVVPPLGERESDAAEATGLDGAAAFPVGPGDPLRARSTRATRITDRHNSHAAAAVARQQTPVVAAAHSNTLALA